MEDGGKLIDLGQPDHLHDQLTLAYSFKVGIYWLGTTFSSFFCLLPFSHFLPPLLAITRLMVWLADALLSLKTKGIQLSMLLE